MKKFVIVLLCAALALGLFACSNDTKSEGGDAESSADKIKLTDMIGSITEGVEVPASDVFELDKSMFKDYSYTEWVDGIEALCSESIISSTAHSLVLVRTNGQDAEKLAMAIADNADVRKWICVQAQIGKVLYTDNYVFMVMTFRDAYDGIKANFEKVVGSDDVKVLDIKSSLSE